MGKRKSRDKRQDPPPKKPKQTSTSRKTRAQNTVTEEPGPEPGNQQYCLTRSRSRSRNTNAAAATTVPQAQREPAAAQADRAGGTTSQQPPHPRTSGEVPRTYTSSTISSSFPSRVTSTNFLQGNMERESQPRLPSQYGISQTDDTVQQNEQTSYTEPQGLPQGPGARSRTYHPNQSPLHPASDRLGTSTPQNIRGKIWRGEFIDLTVLVDSQDNATQVMQDAAEQERANLTVAQVEGTWVLKPFTPPPKNKIFSIEAWTNAFLVYMSIYIEAHPASVHDLLKYCHLIRSAASRYHGFGWRDYDTEFRHRLHRRGGSWATMDGELWLLHVIGGGSPRMARGVDYPPRFTQENRDTERRRY